jgi:hypothetical protein
VIVLENVAGAWKVDVDLTVKLFPLVVPKVAFPLAAKLPLSEMDWHVKVPLKVGLLVGAFVARPWST